LLPRLGETLRLDVSLHRTTDDAHITLTGLPVGEVALQQGSRARLYQTMFHISSVGRACAAQTD